MCEKWLEEISGYLAKCYLYLYLYLYLMMIMIMLMRFMRSTNERASDTVRNVIIIVK